MKRNFFKSLILALGAFALGLIHPAAAQQPNTLKHSIPAPAGAQSGARLGSSVAVDGGLTVVGAPRDSIGALGAGVVKVFDSATGALLHVIPKPSPNNYHFFGNAVAISGSRVVVGAYHDDAGGYNSGSAYVYDLSSGTPTVPVVTLNNPSPAQEDEFGYSVAISGTRVVIGVPSDDTGANNAGIAYVYDLGSATPAVPVRTLNKPTPAALDSFGLSVAISGTRIVVGAPFDDTGANNAGSAYVYDVGSGTPTIPTATLNNPSAGANDSFGWSVAIDGPRALVGAPYDSADLIYSGIAYLYHLESASPAVPVATLSNPSPSLGDFFAISVAISGTGAVVGAYADETGATGAGRAYVYDLASGTPAVPVVTLNNPGAAEYDQFGLSVAISGPRVVIGAPFDDTGTPDAGTAYVYDMGSGTPTVPSATLNNPGPSLSDSFGSSVAISGTRMVVGAPLNDTAAPDAGCAYVYDLASGTPMVPVTILYKPTPSTGDFFGITVAISGPRVVVGAIYDDTAGNNAGSAYVYDLSSGTPTVPVVTLSNPTPAQDDYFGYSMAISGTRVVIGAYFDDAGANNAGAAYVYDVGSGTPTEPLATLNNPSPAAQDYFGISVAISGPRVVVGAYGDDAGATDAGIAYVYNLESGTPTVPVTTLNNPANSASDNFGQSVAISDTRVVIAAPSAEIGTDGAGIAYVYDVGSGTPTVPVTTLNDPGPTAGGFGESLAISGTRVVVGDTFNNTGGAFAGSAYVYDLSSGTPTVPVATLNNPTPAADDQFGRSVAIDGLVVAIGSPGDDLPQTDKGFVYVYGPPDLAGPAGGSFTITPALPVSPTATLTGTFAGWTDASLPLTYEVREGAAVIVAADSNAAPTFTLPAGIHSITGRVYDSAGNFTDVGPVAVLVDGSAPTITTPGNLAVSATSLAGAVVNFSVSATDDLHLNPTVTANPPSGSIFPFGTTTVTVTAKDGVNNQSSATFTVTVTLDIPVATAISTTGSAVPGAGSDTRIAAGAVWTSLATPAINDAGQVAYLGKWKAPAGVSPAQSGVGIFIDHTLLVKSGQTVPKAGTIGLPDNATFKSFRDPVIDAAGHVSFLANIAGTGISPANDTVVMSNAETGVLKVLAREGAEAPETGGAKFKSFANVSALGSANGGTLFTASLKAGAGNPKVTSASDTGVWWLPAGGNSVLNLTREGNPGFSGDTIKSFLALSAVSGSPGHGRGLASGNSALIRLTLGPVPRQALVRAIPGVITELAGTGTAIGGTTLPTATWKTMNLPASGNAGQNIAVLGSLTANTGGTSTGDVKGIYVSANGGVDWEPLARMTNVAHGFATIGASYVAISDPVISSTDASVAFMGTVKGGPVCGSDNSVIWWRPQGAEVTILAREGEHPPGAPAGAKWNTFTSLAFPGDGAGPIFTATLKRGAANGKITAKDDMALYATDSDGTIHEVIREGQPLANPTGKTVKTFNVLKAVAGTAGVTRAFNDNHQIAAFVTFMDGTSGIVKIEVP